MLCALFVILCAGLPTAARGAEPQTPQQDTGPAPKTAVGNGKPTPPAAQGDTRSTPQTAQGDTKPASQAAGGSGAAAAPDNRPPAVTGGTPTITDTAALTLPGWVECDPGSLKNLNRDRILGTPFLLKVTDPNQRLQYRLASDGYVRLGTGVNSYGDTYAGLHYLIASQEKVGFDVAGRFTVKIPTADPQIGGTKKFDYYALFLGSRDFTKWGLHGDFNLGLSSLSRPAAGGTDYQYLLSGALTVPIRGGRWQYTNELVYFSPIEGQRYRTTTMHGFAFANHRYEVYSAALQWQLHGDGPTFQVLVAGSFFLTKLF
jgi:hypothetical protein